MTGTTIVSSGGQGGSSSVPAETLLAGAGALAVLAVVFGSFVAVAPLVIAAVAIPSAFVFIDALTFATTMSILVQNIDALVGLGVAIDYALLIVTRWREERAAGLGNRAAVLRASATAGRSVLFSGITVTVSLAAPALTNIPVLRNIGLAGMLIPLISIAVSATLLPAATAPAGASAGLDALTASGIGPGVLQPAGILLSAQAAILAPGDHVTVAAPAARTPNGLRMADAWSPPDPSPPGGKTALRAIQAAAATVPGARAGGSPAQDADFVTTLHGPNLAVILTAIMVLTFLLLARALRSLWLPVKALLLNLISPAAAFGVPTSAWQQGHGTTALFPTPATGAVTL